MFQGRCILQPPPPECLNALWRGKDKNRTNAKTSDKCKNEMPLCQGKGAVNKDNTGVEDLYLTLFRQEEEMCFQTDRTRRRRKGGIAGPLST